MEARQLDADCHVVFAGAYYSARTACSASALWVRAGLNKVELFPEYTLIATHRPARPDERRT